MPDDINNSKRIKYMRTRVHQSGSVTLENLVINQVLHITQHSGDLISS